MLEKINILYTNDIHSNFSQWSRVTHYIQKTRQFKQRLHEECFVVDIGDHIDRVASITEATMGQANIQLMNKLNYDVVTIGNNEGITLSANDLYHLYDQAKFSVVCSNLMPLDSVKPSWLENLVTLKTKSGVRIGLIGLTAPFNAFYHLLHWHVENPFTVIREMIAEVKETHDIVILLSHLGLNEDEEIARLFPEIDLIIGGHTHHVLQMGKLVNQTLLTAAGKHGQYVGNVQLIWNHETKELSASEAHAIRLQVGPRDIGTEALLTELTESAEQTLNHVVAHINTPYEVDWYKQTPIIEKLTYALQKWTNADCAMLNAGVLLDSLPAGEVTLGMVHNICPHPMNPCVVELSGDELLEVIRSAETDYLTHYPLVGFGFRGEVVGKMVYSNMQLEWIQTEQDQPFIKTIYIHGERLDSKKTYRLATADTFTFGTLFPQIRMARIKEFFLPEFLRDVLKAMLQGG